MPRQVFISYSHQDRAFLAAFQEHLKPFEVTGSLDIWTDQDIPPNQKWHDDGSIRIKGRVEHWRGGLG